MQPPLKEKNSLEQKKNCGEDGGMDSKVKKEL